MSGQGLVRLQRLLMSRYDALRAQIAHRLGGSQEMAADALHDAYVRLASQADLDDVKFPRTYLVNTAVNSAIDRIRKDVRLVNDDDIEAIFEQARDECPGQERELLGRERMAQVMAVLNQLPPRQSELLVSHRVHGEETELLAKRWGISARMIRREIQKANDACLAALEKLDRKGGQE
ncbi:RNA polymerase sigma factor [Pollutimonas bauzanensis]|uniref:RNA polymerase sigma-70 factor, ECF subfamily n=1 Tax=Pollutimonas bauzanensis TaxID=658167 RepID=A0A1M6BDI6_9BURK|nr:sigma-70 family RNA polymerase sigma factor [Pollutimonas bauzanensis]SHI46618.1 RNA polymerase sigma-70 factor, ECF subfamily [Pollutimonas bauzanensis]